MALEDEVADQNQLGDVYGLEDPPKKGPWKGIILGGCLVVLLVGVLVCCGGGIAALALGPEALAKLAVNLFVDDAPLPAPTARWDEADVEALGVRLEASIDEDRTLSLTGEEFSQLVLHGIDDPQLTVFYVSVDEKERISSDISYQLDPAQQQWVNMHVVGTMEMEDGWFTEFTIDEWTIGTFDLGQYMAGQDLTADANQNLAQQKAQDPEVEAATDMVEYLGVEDGRLVLTLTEEGIAQLEAEGEL
jgi:hypothetical protein